jgi:predicted aldo/keto reductase-like oxidoreductase
MSYHDEQDAGGLSRREFLKRTGATAAAISAAAGAAEAQKDRDTVAKMPMRTLGRTGATVSLLGFGGGSQFLAAPEEEAAQMLERAVAAGITYFDTAASYGPARASEKRFGKTLPRHRARIFLATKTDDRTYDGMMRSVEQSLKLLQTDHLDLMQMHDVGPRDDPEAWEKPTGALTALRKMKEQKMIRFIGFTGHQRAEVHKNVIERYDFDTVLMALNAAEHRPFREVALPAAVKKKMGVIAMKATRGLVGSRPGKSAPRDLLSYTWDLPGVAVAIIGHRDLAMLNDNLSHALAYRPGAVDGKALAAAIAPHVTAEQLGWAVPGYRDGVA